MPALSTEFKKGDDDPGTQRNGYDRKKRYVKCYAVSTRNEIHEDQHSRNTKHHQQYAYPIKEMKSSHASHSEKSREKKNDQYLDHQRNKDKGAEFQPL